MAIQKPNIKAAIGVITTVSALFGAVFVFEDRYANASEMAVKLKTQEEQIVFLQESLQRTSTKILSFIKAQAITRRTILEMKEADGILTREEKVELKNLTESLKDI